jgi:hypothetical protein
MVDIPLEKKETTLGDILDVVKELTKAITTLTEKVVVMEKEWEKWRKAGKF